MLKYVLVANSAFTKLIRFMLSIKVLMCLRCLAGYYQKITDNFHVIRVLTAYSILINTFMPMALLWSVKPIFYYQAYCEIIDHYVLIFMSIYTQEVYFSECISGLHRIVAMMRLSTLVEDETLLTRFVNILVYFRIVIVLASCYLFDNEKLNTGGILFLVSLIFVVYSKDIASIPVLIILEIYRDRVKILRRYTEQYLQGIRQENVRSKLLKLKKIIYIYKNLLDVMERKFNVIKFMIAFKFAIECRGCMIFVHQVLSNLIENREPVYFYRILPHTVISVLLTVLLPLLFELSTEEADKITTILADQLLTCPENEVREALLDALSYLRERRVRCVVWRVLDIDASTPFTFLALVTYYVTIMIQFMKPKLDSS